MRNEFVKQLDQLHQMLMEMGQECEEIIENTYQALIKDKEEYLKQIQAHEQVINHMERDIESQCMRLLLLQAPVASDLRKISSALKMITDMERIGDQASDIGDIIKKEGSLTYLVSRLPLKEMAKATQKMVNDSIQSFVSNDDDLAQRVMDSDDVVDDLFIDIHDLLSKDVIVVQDRRALDVLMIAKYYERIGDHATNIAQWVYYSITGIREPVMP